VRVLHRVPVHTSCHVIALDRGGRRATVHLAADRLAHVTGRAVATNHREHRMRPRSRRWNGRSGWRSCWRPGADARHVAAALLRPRLSAPRFGAGFGTLYTTEYRPAEG
jgi:predicted choloylglycine hydrolase